MWYDFAGMESFSSKAGSQKKSLPFSVAISKQKSQRFKLNERRKQVISCVKQKLYVP